MSYDVWKRGAGADLRRWARPLGVPLPDLEQSMPDSINEVRFIAGVRPVEQTGVSSSRGPGSENRTRFLAFFGVLAAGLCMSSIASPIIPPLVRCEMGEVLLESEMELLLRLRADWRVSIVNCKVQGQPS